MNLMKVGRHVKYLEIFEIDTDKIPSGRDDLDLCQRLLWAADPNLTQQIKSGKKETGIKLLSRTQNGIVKNPVYPVPDIPEGLNEIAPIFKKGKRA